jgi:hypothetical protein
MHLSGIGFVYPHTVYEDTDALRKAYNRRNAKPSKAKIRLEWASHLVA